MERSSLLQLPAFAVLLSIDAYLSVKCHHKGVLVIIFVIVLWSCLYFVILTSLLYLVVLYHLTFSFGIFGVLFLMDLDTKSESLGMTTA